MREYIIVAFGCFIYCSETAKVDHWRRNKVLTEFTAPLYSTVPASSSWLRIFRLETAASLEVPASPRCVVLKLSLFGQAEIAMLADLVLYNTRYDTPDGKPRWQHTRWLLRNYDFYLVDPLLSSQGQQADRHRLAAVVRRCGILCPPDDFASKNTEHAFPPFVGRHFSFIRAKSSSERVLTLQLGIIAFTPFNENNLVCIFQVECPLPNRKLQTRLIESFDQSKPEYDWVC